MYATRDNLAQTLAKLPKLIGLHVIQCYNVSQNDVLSLAESILHLQSLACTIIVCYAYPDVQLT